MPFSLPRKTQLYALVVLFIFTTNCSNSKSNTTANTATSEVNAAIPVYDFKTFEPLLYTNTDKTYLVNFWAMWCAPCVKELPYIEAFAEKHPDVEVILVSLDFPKDIDTKLKPFLEDKNINAKVVLLDDPDANSWIDQINPNWTGAIPYTILFNKDKRLYFERSFESINDIETQIQNLN